LGLAYGNNMSEPTRVYTRQDGKFSIEWRPELCVHCEECITGLPQVFDLKNRPWVSIDAASEEEVRRQVSECPTQALFIP
jgi:uncharacterized Fe-S cluster protein YjdI